MVFFEALGSKGALVASDNSKPAHLSPTFPCVPKRPGGGLRGFF